MSLIVLADDYGNFRSNPDHLRGAAFWARDPDENSVTKGGVDALLAELATADLVVLYTVRGQRYGHLKGWSKNQRVDHPGKPRVPSMPSGEEDSEIGRVPNDSDPTLVNSSRDSRESLKPDLRSDHDHEGEARARKSREWFDQQDCDCEIPEGATVPPSFLAIAGEMGVTDAGAVFVKFKATKRAAEKTSRNWTENWRAWLVDERKFQRRERDKAPPEARQRKSSAYGPPPKEDT